jgi:peptidoglycan hydrolase-like protein with peptidoglycan-binding domain
LIVLSICGLLAAGRAWAASDLGTSSPAPGKTPQSRVISNAPLKTAKKASSSRRRYRREGAKARLARLKMRPERATAIQQALFQRGYLAQEPTGVYDDPTRDAMKRYQADNGFPATGLPEAKSLMKLGLGPHPLPTELDPAAQARAMVVPADGPAASK